MGQHTDQIPNLSTKSTSFLVCDVTIINAIKTNEGNVLMEAADYFGSLRQEVFNLCPNNLTRVFEVGCGYGTTLEWLKKNKNYQWIGGAEYSSAAARCARSKLDFLIEGDAEVIDLQIEDGSLDMLLCLDVLEHLRDPWKFLFRACTLLKEGGVLIASLPNIRHRSVIIPLLTKGEFDYQDSGILDRTHLRFFTKESAIALVKYSGIDIECVMPTGIDTGSKSDYINKCTFGLFENILAYQYIIKGSRLAN